MKKLVLALASAIALLGIVIPAANASVPYPPVPAPPAGPATAYFYVCNLTSSRDIYGCAQSYGYLHAVRLEDAFVTLFSYNVTTEHIQQQNTDNCIEYNSNSVNYPVRMDTCTDHKASQEWFTSGYGADQLENGQLLGSCLEGSETDGFGNPLTMAPCSKRYDGQNWIQA